MWKDLALRFVYNYFISYLTNILIRCVLCSCTHVVGRRKYRSYWICNLLVWSKIPQVAGWGYEWSWYCQKAKQCYFHSISHKQPYIGWKPYCMNSMINDLCRLFCMWLVFCSNVIGQNNLSIWQFFQQHWRFLSIRFVLHCIRIQPDSFFNQSKGKQLRSGN